MFYIGLSAVYLVHSYSDVHGGMPVRGSISNPHDEEGVGVAFPTEIKEVGNSTSLAQDSDADQKSWWDDPVYWNFAWT